MRSCAIMQQRPVDLFRGGGEKGWLILTVMFAWLLQATNGIKHTYNLVSVIKTSTYFWNWMKSSLYLDSSAFFLFWTHNLRAWTGSTCIYAIEQAPYYCIQHLNKACIARSIGVSVAPAVWDGQGQVRLLDVPHILYNLCSVLASTQASEAWRPSSNPGRDTPVLNLTLKTGLHGALVYR